MKGKIFILVACLVVAAIVGISAADLWAYIIDFVSLAISTIIRWVDSIIYIVKDSISSLVSAPVASRAFLLL